MEQKIIFTISLTLMHCFFFLVNVTQKKIPFNHFNSSQVLHYFSENDILFTTKLYLVFPLSF